ncbi:MAG: hypothetical protein R3B74_18040 [Nitrospirales bacterium]|nr:hypothetical protein [Nitrospirales bacterium]
MLVQIFATSPVCAYRPSRIVSNRSGDGFWLENERLAIGSNRHRTDSIYFAFTGTRGFSGDGGPATAAQLNVPHALVIDRSGNLFIADQGNFRIRRVDARTGIISTVVGNGKFGFSGDGGLAVSASLEGISGLAIDATGTIYLATHNHIRVVRDPNASDNR